MGLTENALAGEWNIDEVLTLGLPDTSVLENLF